MLVRALVERGCRRIVQIVAPKHRTGWWLPRRTGYESAAAACGIPVLPPTVVPTPTHLNDPAGDEEAFADIVRHYAGYLVEHLCGDARADAILAASDASVAALAEACRLFGLEPNRDVLLAGFDNLLEGHWTYRVRPFKPTFTIDKQNFQIGLTMADLLSRRVEGQLQGPPQSTWIVPQLIEVR
jgi:DNA-binding LacI/PurR family transcriptional regulator